MIIAYFLGQILGLIFFLCSTAYFLGYYIERC